jgi:hypothetical protein
MCQPRYVPVANRIEATYPLHAEEFPEGVICSACASRRGCQILKIVSVDERKSTDMSQVVVPVSRRSGLAPT